MTGNMCGGDIAWNWIMRRCGWTRISREILREVFSVCKDIKTQFWLVSWRSNSH